MTPPSLVGVGEKERGGEEEGKGGCTPCPIRTRGGEGASFLLASLLYSRMAQQGPYTPWRIPVTPVLRKIPESLGTFPISEYSRPIYQSLCLDHFETPRHVRDLIRDSEQPSVHQNT